MASFPAPGIDRPVTSFDSLPNDVIAAILLRLEVTELGAAACSSKKLRDVALDNTLIWQPLCERHFGHETRPPKWLQAQPTNIAATPKRAEIPRTYRHLYRHLAQERKLVGLWSGMQTGPRGTLYQVQWDVNAMAVCQLSICEADFKVRRKLLLKLGPGHCDNTSELPDDSHCILRRYPAVPRVPCTTAQAATEVATSASSSSPLAGKLRPLGSSPPSPFSQEMLSFMHKCVVGSRSSSGSKRRAKKSGGSPGAPAPLPITYHLRRISPPQPTRAHPLAGIWQGLYGPHGVEIISVSYDFTSPAAVLRAVKITGDPNVPAGEITWQAVAAAIPQPWAQAEVWLMNLYHVNELGDESDPSHSPRVVSCHEGYGQEADDGFVNALWCPGRLWVYDDGRIAFVWQPHFRIVYHRVDADLSMSQYEADPDTEDV